MSPGCVVYAVLLMHFKPNILCFLLKLCKYECGWGKLQDVSHVKI